METNDYSLEQMRSDYSVLKNELDKQEIINDSLMRDVMMTKIRSIRSLASVNVICGIFVIVASPFVFHYNPVINASWWFVGGTVALMAFCIFLDWKYNHKVQSTDIASCDLLTFSKSVRELKTKYKDWVKWGLLLGILWASWLGLEVWFNSEEPKLAISMLVGIAVGLVAGGLIGWRMNRRIIQNCDDIISQIENQK